MTQTAPDPIKEAYREGLERARLLAMSRADEEISHFRVANAMRLLAYDLQAMKELP